MKKILWWLMILVCSFLILVVLLTANVLLFSPKESGMVSSTPSDNYIIIAICIVALALLVFGLIKGIKNVRKKISVQITPYTKQLDITASGRIAYKDYRNLIASLSLRKRFIFYFIIMAVLLSTNMFFRSYDPSHRLLFEDFGGLAGFLLIVGLVVLLTFIQIKKQYKTNTILNEHLNYHLTNEQLEIKGETINSILKWNHFYKMRETKIFYLFYHGNNVAIIIDKQIFSDHDLEELSAFLKSLNIQHI